MLKWVPYAFLRITFFFILGTLSAIYIGEYLLIDYTYFILGGFFLLYVLVRFFLIKNKFFSFSWVHGSIAFTIIFLLGYLNLHLNNESRRSNHLIHHENISHYQGIVNSPPEEKANTFKYDFKVERVFSDSTWKPASGTVYLYVKKDQALQHYGDRLIINGSPNKIKPPMNPGEFDYKRFLSFNNVYHQAYVTDEYIKLGNEVPNIILKYSYIIRKEASDILSTYITTDRELNIAKALILGVKEGLTDDIEKAYSASGAMHVLAVSGLHVGIVYGIVLLLFKPFRKTRLLNWLMALVSLCVLWGYALVTGFSPSVLRAVTMFSFIAVATASGRSTNIYNTLAASCCFLLLYNPYLIMSVGFQLSYLAVVGIVYIQPRLYQSIEIDNYILDQIWAITAVSIAAQLATVSLTVLYFHQFPTFFLLSNLIVIPGAFIILCGGLLLLLISPIQVLAAGLGWVLQKLIWFVNITVFQISAIPFSQITDIDISVLQAWLIIGTVVGFFLVLERKRFTYILFITLCIVGFATVEWSQTLRNINDKSVTFYRVNDHLTMGLKDGLNLKILSDTIFLTNKESMRFHIRPSVLQAGIVNFSSSSFDSYYFSEKSNFKTFDWGDKSFLFLENYKYNELKNKVYFDYVILSKNFRNDLTWINNNLDYDKIIIDGSLKWYLADSLKEQFDKHNVSYYSVFHDGALVIKIN